MSHDHQPVDPLPETATLRDVIAKLNEVIEHINFMWFPEDGV